MDAGWIPGIQSNLDVYSPNLIHFNLADVTSWQGHKGFDKPYFHVFVAGIFKKPYQWLDRKSF